MFVHVLKIPTSSINHTWDVFIKHVCIDTKKIHVCITSLPLHIVFFLRDSFKTKPSQLPNQKIHSAKKKHKNSTFFL